MVGDWLEIGRISRGILAPVCDFHARVRSIGLTVRMPRQVYETLLYLFTPFILPMSVAVNPAFWAYVLVGTVFLYFLNVLIFNELHLRLKNERVSWTVLIIYYVRSNLASRRLSSADHDTRWVTRCYSHLSMLLVATGRFTNMPGTSRNAIQKLWKTRRPLR